MRAISFALTALAAIAVPVSASAQAADAAQDQSDVVVVGKKQQDRAQEARSFVGALAGIPGPDPIGRFDRTEVCPAVVGLEERHNTAIADRMRRIAGAAGIPVAPVGCRPNALVLVSANKQEMIAALRKTHPVYFRDVMQNEITVPEQAGPAIAWHLGARVDRQGVAIDGSPNVARMDGPQTVQVNTGATRIGVNARPVFIASVVVVEIKALDGLTVTQIGDYAAMRTFADIDPGRLRRVTAPTILTVLDAPMESETPLTLTQWDLAYLRGLYAAQPFHSARQQRAAIGAQVIDKLKGRDRTPD